MAHGTHLAEQGVHESRFAVIDVSDHGDVAGRRGGGMGGVRVWREGRRQDGDGRETRSACAAAWAIIQMPRTV